MTVQYSMRLFRFLLYFNYALIIHIGPKEFLFCSCFVVHPRAAFSRDTRKS